MPMICDEFISKMDITEERFRVLEDNANENLPNWKAKRERNEKKKKKRKATEYPGIIRIPNINKQPIIRVENGFIWAKLRTIAQETQNQ